MLDPTTLKDAFLRDHQILTRGLAALQSAVSRGDGPLAKSLAELLDRDAGPHIEFEETMFYPMLIEVFGKEFVRGLYSEHDCCRRALEYLREIDQGSIAWEELRDSLRIAMDHVKSCGSLTSHLVGLDPDRRRELLDGLIESRERGTKWTEIDRAKRVDLLPG